jgi:hypothetical protein
VGGLRIAAQAVSAAPWAADLSLCSASKDYARPIAIDRLSELW